MKMATDQQSLMKILAATTTTLNNQAMIAMLKASVHIKLIGRLNKKDDDDYGNIHMQDEF